MYPDCHFWIMFKHKNAKCISYVTLQHLRRDTKKPSIANLTDFFKADSRLLWSSVSESCCLGKYIQLYFCSCPLLHLLLYAERKSKEQMEILVCELLWYAD